MKITLVQSDIAWGDPVGNRRHLESLLEGVGQTDLILLPEMFSTGFVTKPEGLAETDCASLQWMRRMARERGCAVAGSIATQEGDRFYNRFHFVPPEGASFHYDKHHLFTYAGEDKHFTPGRERVVVPWKDMRILLQVCYDLRFPVFSRNRLVPDETGGLRPDYDLILYVASWPDSRFAAWETLLCARAIENQCFVAGVNRVGRDPGNSYCGGSALINPQGDCLAACTMGREEVVTAEAGAAGLADFRRRFPFLADADFPFPGH